MTTQLASVPDADAEIRWRAWQARGAEADRRTMQKMRGLLLLIVAGFVVWWFAQLA